MKFSLNNHLIVKPYTKEALKPKTQGGIAMPGQRDGLKGLEVLVTATISDGRLYKEIPKGSTVYVKEETLHTQAWASKTFICDGVEERFMILESVYIELVDTQNYTTS